MSKRKKVWVTKYWATKGVFTDLAEPMDSGSVYVGQAGQMGYACCPTDHAKTRAEAVGQVAKKRAAKLASLRKQIAKVEAIDPEKVVPE